MIHFQCGKRFLQQLVWGLIRWSSRPSVVRSLVLAWSPSIWQFEWVPFCSGWNRSPSPLSKVYQLIRLQGTCHYLTIFTQAQLQANGEMWPEDNHYNVLEGNNWQFSLGYMSKAGGGGGLLKQLAPRWWHHVWTCHQQSFNPFTPLCEGNYDKGSSKKNWWLATIEFGITVQTTMKCQI